MQHKLENSIHQLQLAICPEAGAGLGGIEIKRCCIVSGIQGYKISLSIQQAGNTGGKSVRLTIAQATIEKLKKGITLQLKRTTCQVGDGIRSSIIDTERILIPEDKGGSQGRSAGAQRAGKKKSHACQNRLTKEHRKMQFHNRKKNCAYDRLSESAR